MKYNYLKSSISSISLQISTLTNKTAILLLKSYFNPKSVLINTPTFQVFRNTNGIQLTIQLFYYSANNEDLSRNSLNNLVTSLTELYENAYGEPVNVEMELVRQSRPYLDAEILAHYLAINASKYGFNRLINSVLNVVPYASGKNESNHHPQSICGIKIQLSGLLTSQRNRSRKSVYTASAGTFHSCPGVSEILTTNNGISTASNIQALNIQYASHTTKSRLGSFTVKI